MYAEVKSALQVLIPESLVVQLLDHHRVLKAALLSGDWERCLVRAGKLAEAVMRIVHHLRTGRVVSRIAVQNEIQAAEQDTNLPGGVRIMIPRHVRVLYDHRSKRGGAHTSFDPNEMDSRVAASVADWIVAELLRLYGQASPGEALSLVQGLTRRQVPYVDEIDGDIVPLGAATIRQDIGLVLYKRYPGRVTQADLRKWLTGSKANAIAVAIHRMKKDREIHVNVEGMVLTSRGLAAVEADIGTAEGA